MPLTFCAFIVKGDVPSRTPLCSASDPRFNFRAFVAMWREIETHAESQSLLKVAEYFTTLYCGFLDCQSGRETMKKFCIYLLLSSALLPASVHVAALASKVIVTGASGRTGKLVFSQLSNNPKFEAVGCVRSESSAKRLMKDVPNCRLEQLAIVDVTNMDPSSEQPKLLEDADAMIICTSAVPKISKSSVIRQMLKIPLNVIRKKPAINFRGFRFRYQPGQHPEKVDFEGQKKQIALAKKLGVKRVVVVR